LASIVMYVVVGELVRPAIKAINPSVSYTFTTLAVALIGVIFVVRRTLVARPGLTLAKQPDDVLNLNQWKTGYIATYVLCEGLALLGLVQRFMGSSLKQSFPYYFGGFVLMLFFWPRQPGNADL
jgi:hypothetical protein